MKPSAQTYNPRDFDPVLEVALLFPGTEQSVSHEGTPSVKIRKKLMCRLHDNGRWIPIQLDFAVRDHFLDRYPEVFELPDHFVKWPYLVMRVNAFDRRLLTEVLEASWRGLASKTMIRDFDARGGLKSITSSG